MKSGTATSTTALSLWEKEKEEEEAQCCTPQQAQSVDIYTGETMSSSLQEASYCPKAAYDIHVPEAISQPKNSKKFSGEYVPKPFQLYGALTDALCT